MPKRTHQQPGVVMILALLLLAGVTASTIGTSITISNTAGQSKNIDNFILASVAGDSGVERSLAIIKYYRKSGNIVQAINAINSVSSTITLGAASFSGTARPASDPILVPVLRPGERTSLDVFEYDPTTGALPTLSTAKYLYIKGTTTAGNLEVSWVLIDQFGDSSCTGRYFADATAINAGVWPDLLSNTKNQSGDSCDTLSPKGFRVGLRALDLTGTTTVAEESIINLTAEAYPCNNNTCSPSGVPGRIQIDINGSAGTTRALKTASVLWQLPSSGLFNYVLFTEGDIVPN
jgi:hypothetical protein